MLRFTDNCALLDVPADDQKNPVSPYGETPEPFSFELSKIKPSIDNGGGSVKIVDSTTFKVSTTIAAAEVTVEPGAMRFVSIYWLARRLILTPLHRELHVRLEGYLLEEVCSTNLNSLVASHPR